MGVSKGTQVDGPTDWASYTVANSGNLVQPSVVRSGSNPSELVCLFRDRRAQNVYRATSTSEGETWTTPAATVLPNNNAGIEAFGLASKAIILAFNPQRSGRDPLAVALSDDNGVTWPHQRLVQHGNSDSGYGYDAKEGVGAGANTSKGNEFSYPTIMQTSDGVIHMMYTYDRDTIKCGRACLRCALSSASSGVGVAVAVCAACCGACAIYACVCARACALRVHSLRARECVACAWYAVPLVRRLAPEHRVETRCRTPRYKRFNESWVRNAPPSPTPPSPTPPPPSPTPPLPAGWNAFAKTNVCPPGDKACKLHGSTKTLEECAVRWGFGMRAPHRAVQCVPACSVDAGPPHQPRRPAWASVVLPGWRASVGMCAVGRLFVLIPFASRGCCIWPRLFPQICLLTAVCLSRACLRVLTWCWRVCAAAAERVHCPRRVRHLRPQL